MILLKLSKVVAKMNLFTFAENFSIKVGLYLAKEKARLAPVFDLDEIF